MTIPATYIGLEDSCHSIFCDTLVDNSPLNENSFARAFGGAGGNAPRTPLVGENITASVLIQPLPMVGRKCKGILYEQSSWI